MVLSGDWFSSWVRAVEVFGSIPNMLLHQDNPSRHNWGPATRFQRQTAQEAVAVHRVQWMWQKALGMHGDGIMGWDCDGLPPGMRLLLHIQSYRGLFEKWHKVVQYAAAWRSGETPLDAFPSTNADGCIALFACILLSLIVNNLYWCVPETTMCICWHRRWRLRGQTWQLASIWRWPGWLLPSQHQVCLSLWVDFSGFAITAFALYYKPWQLVIAAAMYDYFL